MYDERQEYEDGRVSASEFNRERFAGEEIVDDFPMPDEICLGRHSGKKVGDRIWCDAGAPGVGHVIYEITTVCEDGSVWGVEVENTIWIPDPESFR